MVARGHRIAPHTADVIVEAWGPDLAACVEEAVAGVLDCCVDVRSARVVAEHDAVLGPGAPESLVLDALDELIFVLDTSAAPPIGASARPIDDGERLDVVFRLADPTSVAATGAGPKAISRSGFALAATPDGVRGTFIVDV